MFPAMVTWDINLKEMRKIKVLNVFYSIWINCGIGFFHSNIICNESELNNILSILKKDHSVKIEKIAKYEEK